MKKFAISDEFGASLELSSRELVDPGRGVEQLKVRVAAPGLSAEGIADVAEFPDRLFSDMARQWAGWPGELAWESLESELTLKCTHDRTRGRVCIAVTLGVRRLGNWASQWQIQVVVETEAGQLERIAAEAEAFFRSADG